mmetsp:Transcript_39045/g.69953  ORF Transcript_39045/g.69953 Transcript_39045/m.69953 type:complete len:81 (+) Transcript_39045:955-1197(+)
MRKKEVTTGPYTGWTLEMVKGTVLFGTEAKLGMLSMHKLHSTRVQLAPRATQLINFWVLDNTKRIPSVLQWRETGYLLKK